MIKAIIEFLLDDSDLCSDIALYVDGVFAIDDIDIENITTDDINMAINSADIRYSIITLIKSWLEEEEDITIEDIESFFEDEVKEALIQYIEFLLF